MNSLIKRNRNGFPTLTTMWDDFFNRDWMDFPTTGTTLPAVNIQDNPEDWQLEVAAPGLKKEDFKITLDKNLLTISSEKEQKTEEQGEGGTYTRREFSYQSFSRSFSLPETADQENIEASYVDGVLNISIPKKEAAKVITAKEIKIS